MSSLSAFDVLIDFWHLPPSCTVDQWIVAVVNAQMSTEIKSIRQVETFLTAFGTEKESAVLTVACSFVYSLPTNALQCLMWGSVCQLAEWGAKRVSRGWTGQTVIDITCHHHLIDNGWLLLKSCSVLFISHHNPSRLFLTVFYFSEWCLATRKGSF